MGHFWAAIMPALFLQGAMPEPEVAYNGPPKVSVNLYSIQYPAFDMTLDLYTGAVTGRAPCLGQCPQEDPKNRRNYTLAQDALAQFRELALRVQRDGFIDQVCRARQIAAEAEQQKRYDYGDRRMPFHPDSSAIKLEGVGSLGMRNMGSQMGRLKGSKSKASDVPLKDFLETECMTQDARSLWAKANRL